MECAVPAVELDPTNSFAKNVPLNSRFTGCELVSGEMIVTIISQGTFSMGHQAIAFEWGDNTTGVLYRKFKVFHLYPQRGSSLNELGAYGSISTTVPGRIERLRKTTVNEQNVPKSVEKGKYGSDVEAASQFLLTTGARYRSWRVDFSGGWAAFLAAKEQWKDATKTPSFNLVGWGGHSCGTWVQSIASIAGIPSTSFAAWVGFVVPAWEVAGSAQIFDEAKMWEGR